MPNHRRSIRLKNYNYASTNAYFITLVTWKRLNLFGEITNGEMHINTLGSIVHKQWIQSAKIRNEVTLDGFVIMPNHIHAIVFLDNKEQLSAPGRPPVAPTGQRLPAGTGKKTLGALVAGFKSACTREFNQIKNKTESTIWQRNFYERVIRNQRELDAVREYIQNNPLNWKLDSENTDHRIDR